LVTPEHSAVKFFMPFDDFKTSAVPSGAHSYQEYRRLSIEFVEARNRRIERFVAVGHSSNAS